MAKSLPDSIELNSAVRKEYQLQGEVWLSELDRMPLELIHSKDAPIKYEILFRHSKSVLGEAIIRIESKLELICQRSLEPSWVDDMLVEPKALLEDEILLMLPDIPVKPGAELDSEYMTDQGAEEPEEETENPFAALEALKTKN